MVESWSCILQVSYENGKIRDTSRDSANLEKKMGGSPCFSADKSGGGMGIVNILEWDADLAENGFSLVRW